MMSDLHPVVSVMLLVGMMVSWIWIGAEVMRRYSARGTRPRWYWAGVERAARYPAGSYLGMSALVSFRYHDWVYFLVESVGVALWLYVLWEKKNGDQDDDFWTTVGDRLRGALNARPAVGTTR